MHFTNVALILLVSLGIVFSAPSSPQRALRIQPELDRLDIGKYLKNERLVRYQFKCLIFDGPCDAIGKWAKQRAQGLLVGRCDYCTPRQQGWITEWYDTLIEKFPDMYRAAVAKYILNEGIEIAEEEKQKIQEAFGDDDNAVGDSIDTAKELEKTKIANSTSTTVPAGNEKLTTVITTAATEISATTSATTNDEVETSTSFVENITEMESSVTEVL